MIFSYRPKYILVFPLSVTYKVRKPVSHPPQCMKTFYHSVLSDHYSRYVKAHYFIVYEYSLSTITVYQDPLFTTIVYEDLSFEM